MGQNGGRDRTGWGAGLGQNGGRDRRIGWGTGRGAGWDRMGAG